MRLARREPNTSIKSGGHEKSFVGFGPLQHRKRPSRVEWEECILH